MFLTKRIVKWKIVGEDKGEQMLVKVYQGDMIWSENRDVLQLQNQKDNFGIQVEWNSTFDNRQVDPELSRSNYLSVIDYDNG